jgi:hypothetical protein
MTENGGEGQVSIPKGRKASFDGVDLGVDMNFFLPPFLPVTGLEGFSVRASFMSQWLHFVEQSRN